MTIKEIQKASLFTAIKTPYKANGAIDLDAYSDLMQLQVEANVDGVIVGGTTGEGHLMSWDEHITLIAFSVLHFGDNLIIIGNTGSNNTREAKNATEQGFMVGMDASLQVNPYYGKASDDGLIRHFSEVLEYGPAMIYNVPSRTAQHISDFVIDSIAKHSNFLGVKECAGNDRISSLSKRGISAWSGNDDQCFEARHKCGAKGVVSVCSNIFPKSYRKLMDDPKASSLNQILEPLLSLMYAKPNPIGLNTIMAMMGLCQPVFRLPYLPLNQEEREVIYDFLNKLNIEEIPSEINLLYDEEFLTF